MTAERSKRRSLIAVIFITKNRIKKYKAVRKRNIYLSCGQSSKSFLSGHRLDQAIINTVNMAEINAAYRLLVLLRPPFSMQEKENKKTSMYL